MIVRRHASLHIIERARTFFPSSAATGLGKGFSQKLMMAQRKAGRAPITSTCLMLLCIPGGLGRQRCCGRAVPPRRRPATLPRLCYGERSKHVPRLASVPLQAREPGDSFSSSCPRPGQQSSLLDTETNVSGVVTGKLRQELKAIGVVSRVGGGQLNADAGDLDVTARWAISGQKGVTMPSKGKVETRVYSPEERAALVSAAAAALGLDETEVLNCLGDTTCDVYPQRDGLLAECPLEGLGTTHLAGIR